MPILLVVVYLAAIYMISESLVNQSSDELGPSIPRGRRFLCAQEHDSIMVDAFVLRYTTNIFNRTTYLRQSKPSGGESVQSLVVDYAFAHPLHLLVDTAAKIDDVSKSVNRTVRAVYLFNKRKD